MGVNGRRTVEERFTWDKIAGETLALYNPEGVEPAAAVAPVAASETVAPLPSAAPRGEAARPVAAVPQEEATPKAEPAAAIRVSVKLSLKRRRNGLSVADSKAACEQILAESGLPARFKGDTARIEGEWDAILGAVNRCYARVNEIGKAQITATVEMPGAVDELVAWEESEIHEDLQESPVGSTTQSTYAIYVEGRGSGQPGQA
jgi:uncharacterized protein YqgV (UPF0045/DUF77 family)